MLNPASTGTGGRYGELAQRDGEPASTSTADVVASWPSAMLSPTSTSTAGRYGEPAQRDGEPGCD
jgi:hypothetical protein